MNESKYCFAISTLGYVPLIGCSLQTASIFVGKIHTNQPFGLIPKNNNEGKNSPRFHAKTTSWSRHGWLLTELFFAAMWRHEL